MVGKVAQLLATVAIVIFATVVYAVMLSATVMVALAIFSWYFGLR